MSYADLLRPQWKGKLGIEAEDFDWFAEILKQMGEERGLRLFRDIIAANGISVRKGHSLLNNLVAAGEMPLALTDYGFLAEQSKRKGAPLDWFVMEPAVARAASEGLARNAPHPHGAALLFYDFLISTASRSSPAASFSASAATSNRSTRARSSSSIPRPCSMRRASGRTSFRERLLVRRADRELDRISICSYPR